MPPLFNKTILVAFSVVVAIHALSPAALAAKKKKSRSTSVSARSAILSDATKQKRLYGKNVHQRVKPASTTKVMTALLVLEHLNLDDSVTVSKAATYVQPSKINLVQGEVFSVEDLLYAILLNSANDASVVLAEAVAGSEAKFVALMNKRARELGAKNTNFVNSNGLPSKQSQYTSAYDMYLIFRQALNHDFFRQAVQLKTKTIASGDGRTVYLKSHNKMLFTKWGNRIFGKTGYTRAAQACFVGFIQKGKSVLIVAVFGCSRRWEDIRHIVRNYGGIAL